MILVDTHVLLWWVADPSHLSRSASSALADDVPARVSPISFWELAMLEQRGRIAVDRDLVRWARDLLAAGKVAVTQVTPSAAIAAARLPAFHGDPADRIIYATARELGARLVTKDTRMREYADVHQDVTVVW